MQKKSLVMALLAGLTLTGAAQAALIDRGGGLIYDNVLNVTWLQDANNVASNVPEPGTVALLTFGLLGLGLARRREKLRA